VDELHNTTVRFRVGDVVHPCPVQVLMELFRDLSLEGEVVTVTTDGVMLYLVVRVAGLPEALIVPWEKTSAFFEDDGVDELQNTTVRFRVGDVVHPRPVQVLMESFRDLFLEGEVVAATKVGELRYLVVRVAGLSEALIVPREKASDFFFEDDGAALTAPAGAGD
jgi:hypothetical protein